MCIPKIGFTGRASGMTEAQKTTVLALLNQFKSFEFLHNDGEGSDQEFADLARSLSAQVDTTTVETPMARNRTLVSLCRELIAAPPTDVILKKGSGTWECIKYAWKANLQVHIVLSDGSIVHTKAEVQPKLSFS